MTSTEPDRRGGIGGGAGIEQALLTFRIIGASLAFGVTTFALASAFVHMSGGGAASPAIDHGTMSTILLLVAVGAVGASVVWWRARVTPLLESVRSASDPAVRFGEIQTNVIIAWALVESAALCAVVVYFLYGDVVTGVLGVALIWTALALTWPKRSWFEG